MVQRDLLHHTRNIQIDVAHHITHAERLKSQDHHTTDHAAQCFLRGKAGYDCDHATGCQQCAHRA